MIKKAYLILISILVICISLSGCEKKDKTSTLNSKKIKSIKLAKGDAKDIIEFNLYFDSSKKDNEVEVKKEPRLIDKEEVIGEILLQELLKGPSIESELKPVFPKDTKLLSFSIKDGIAYANLSSNAKYSMTKKQEQTCLKSLIYTLTSLDSIDKVKVLINNKNEETLGGHYDISKPLSKVDMDILH